MNQPDEMYLDLCYRVVTRIFFIVNISSEVYWTDKFMWITCLIKCTVEKWCASLSSDSLCHIMLQVLREPKRAGQVDQVLGEYSDSIKVNY